MIDTFVDFWRDVARERMRAFLTLLGIVLGASSVVFLASALGAAGVALTRLSQDATGDDITRVEARNPGPLSAAQTTRGLTDRDAAALAEHENLGDVDVGTSRTLYGQEATVGNKRMRVGLQSGGTKFAAISGLELLHGRWIQPHEEPQRLCMIGYDIWQRLFDGKWPLESGQLVLSGSVVLQVVGVFRSKPPIGGGDGDGTWMFDRKLWISNTVLNRSLDPQTSYQEIAMRHRLVDGTLPDLAAMARKLTPLLQNLHLGVKNFEFAALNQGSQLFELIALVLGGIMFACGLVAMIVGGVNVMNAQLVSLHEKTKEYGLRRAVGASAASLRRRVLFDSLLFTTVGGILGIGVGLGGAWALAALLTAVLAPWPFLVVPWSIGAALGTSAVVGLLAGLLPAVRAGELQPSECLRAE